MTAPTTGNSVTDNLPKYVDEIKKSIQYHRGVIGTAIACLRTLETSRFIVGSSCGKENNHLLRTCNYDEQSSKLSTDREYRVGEPFTGLVASPSRPDVILTANSVQGNTKVSILSLENEAIRYLTILGTSFGRVNSLIWDSADSCLVADEKVANIFNGDGSSIASQSIEGCSVARFLGDSPNVIAASERSLKLWDTRSKESSTINLKNVSAISSMDVNPNRNHVVALGGVDGQITVWDLRRSLPTTRPVQVFDAHNHHVNNLQFNPLRDELILSSSKDCSLKVWCCESASSGVIDSIPPLIENQRPPLSPLTNPIVPYRGLCFPDKHTQILTSRDDRLVSQIDRHSDTVNDICWSHASPWVFASVSQDGLVMINSVPKYLSR